MPSQPSLQATRKQQAKSWELRAAMSIARLWRDQGKPHALAAFDYFYLDGTYLHSVQAVANSMLHFFLR